MKEELVNGFEILKKTVMERTASRLEEPLFKAVFSGFDEFAEQLGKTEKKYFADNKGLREENDTLRALIGLGDTDVRAKIVEQGAELIFLREQLLKLKKELDEKDKSFGELGLEAEKLKNELKRTQDLRESENRKNEEELNKLLGKLDAIAKKTQDQQGDIDREKDKLNAGNVEVLDSAGRAMEKRTAEEIKLLGARLRNLGNPITGSSKFLLDKLENIRNAPKTKKLFRSEQELVLELAPDLDLMFRNSQEMVQVLDTYVKLYEEHKPVFENIEFAKLWESLNAKFSNQLVRSGIKVRMPSEKKYPVFISDKKSIQDLCEILITNALEALPKGGTLEISGQFGADSVKMSFADEGPGIKPGDADKLFLPFFSTKPGHWGMGLARARKLVKAIGGSLAYQARNPGCLFVLDIPRRRDNQ